MYFLQASLKRHDYTGKKHALCFCMTCWYWFDDFGACSASFFDAFSIIQNDYIKQLSSSCFPCFDNTSFKGESDMTGMLKYNTSMIEVIAWHFTVIIWEHMLTKATMWLHKVLTLKGEETTQLNRWNSMCCGLGKPVWCSGSWIFKNGWKNKNQAWAKIRFFHQYIILWHNNFRNP